MTDTERLTADERALLEAQQSADSTFPWREGSAHTRSTIQSSDYGTGLPHRDTVARSVRHRDAAYIVAAANAVPGLLSEIARLRGEEEQERNVAAWRGTMLSRYHDPSCSVFSDLPTERAQNEGLGVGNDCDCGDQDALLKGNEELRVRADRAEVELTELVSACDDVLAVCADHPTWRIRDISIVLDLLDSKLAAYRHVASSALPTTEDEK